MHRLMDRARRALRSAWIITAGFVLAASQSGAAPAEPLGPGKGSFLYRQAGKTLPVWYFVPARGAETAPIVFVMHGVKRNGDVYRDEWAPYAERLGFILLCPQFTQEEFPNDAGYNFGNTVSKTGRPNPPNKWGFNMIEPIFDRVRERLGNRSATYSIYGHSAGAQFVHRFLFFVPNARISHVVSANAGWYSFPDLTIDFPYGLRHSAAGIDQLKLALQRPFVVLLGASDVDPNHPELRRTPEAEAQGAYRLARGQSFYEAGRRQAVALRVPFGWTLCTAPGIAHSDQGMAPFAIKWLFPETTVPPK